MPGTLAKTPLGLEIVVFTLTALARVILAIELDGQTYDLNPDVSGNYASVQLNDFEQGLHQIKITLIRP